MPDQLDLKPVIWVGSSRNDCRRLPKEVQSRIGYALYVAQRGGKHRDAKPLKGFGGAKVLEVIVDYSADTFRCIYTLRLAGFLYVLHVFQKKSKTGRETPKMDIDLIARRLRDAERLAQGRQP
jgi:phage-related protein